MLTPLNDNLPFSYLSLSPNIKLPLSKSNTDVLSLLEKLPVVI